jgi:hypothetical protein
LVFLVKATQAVLVVADRFMVQVAAAAVQALAVTGQAQTAVRAVRLPRTITQVAA